MTTNSKPRSPASPHLPWSGWIRSLVFAVALTGLAGAGVAAPSDDRAQTVVHMLDYVGVDYPESVRDGKVLNASEYQEQREFASQAIALLEQLPPAADKAALLGKARQLQARIDAKAAGAEVSALASGVRADVIRLYRLTVAPRQAPDLRKAAALFQARCASCHGGEGRGDGAASRGMEPQPSNFHDEERMSVRSLYGLYNTITLGVAGTPMRGFAELSEADRWALAFFAGALRARPEAVASGEALWTQGQGKAELGNFRALVTLTPAEVSGKGAEALSAVRAYLTARPEAVQSASPAPLDVTREKLAQALTSYRQGDRDAARQSAISAYLDGFELIEASLDNVDPGLRTDIEREMMALRSTIAGAKPVDAVAAQIDRANAMLDRAGDKLGTDGMSPAAAFASSLLILLREGIEAILVLAAIVAFVVKTGRRDALPYIHAGWAAALALGVATWLVASHLLQISGAGRELTEGVSALLAAAMLLYVGYWLHSKSYAQAWQAFIREKVTTALAKRTLWAMAGISFLAVYRELFEVILFYETLWVQAGPGSHGAVLGGGAVAAVLLAALGWAMLKYSVRLPLRPFFAATSALLLLMAVVFVGHGVAALQEAGAIESARVAFVDWPLLGVHATVQGLGAQALALALIGAGLLASRRKAT